MYSIFPQTIHFWLLEISTSTYLFALIIPRHPLWMFFRVTLGLLQHVRSPPTVTAIGLVLYLLWIHVAALNVCPLTSSDRYYGLCIRYRKLYSVTMRLVFVTLRRSRRRNVHTTTFVSAACAILPAAPTIVTWQLYIRINSLVSKSIRPYPPTLSTVWSARRSYSMY